MKTKYDNPIIFVGGDTNNRKLQTLLEDFTDIVTVNAPPTRGDAKLDELVTNAISYIERTTLVAPLETPEGVPSDHSMLLITALVPALHHFTKNKFEYCPITDQGRKEFISRLACTDWACIIGVDVHESADKLCACLDLMVEDCFS